MKFVQIRNQTHPDTQPIRARYCNSFLCRLRGLMFTRPLEPYEGLLMVQPRSDRLDAAIHMFFMGYDLTVVWTDPQYRVVDVQYCKQWRPAYMPAKAAQYVLEIHADRLNAFHTGDQLVIEPC